MTALRLGSLCSGTGGLDIAVNAVFGSVTAWYADPAPSAVALHAHHWPHLSNVGDIRAADWSTVEAVDILTAGYPCQPFSTAGKRQGEQDERHLWPAIADAIRVLGPRVVVLENVAGHRSKGFGTVLGDLAALGYRAAWGSVRASDLGAPHRRDRVLILAVAGDWDSGVAPDTGHGHERTRPRPTWGQMGQRQAERNGHGRGDSSRAVPRRWWRQYEPAIGRWERVLGRPAPWCAEAGRGGQPRIAAEFAEWVMGLPEGHVTSVPGLTHTARLGLCGNGVVPHQAEWAVGALWRLLWGANEGDGDMVLLPTPTASMSSGASRPGASHQNNLQTAVARLSEQASGPASVMTSE